MLPRELPAYKTVRPSFGLGSGPYLHPGRAGPDGKQFAIRSKGGSGFRKFPAKKGRLNGRPLSIIFRRTSESPPPERSLGSNHVVFGGMMLPVSAMLISCCIETG